MRITLPLALPLLVVSAPLLEAGTPGPLESLPTDFDGVVCTGRLWALVGSNGELRELWRGPPEKIDTHGGEPPGVLRVVVFAEAADGDADAWLDLRTLGWIDDGSRPGRIGLRAADGSTRLEVTAQRGGASAAPIVFRYVFRSPRRFRCRVAVGERSAASLAVLGGAALTIPDAPSSGVTLATFPRGAAVASGLKAAIEVGAASEVSVAVYPGLLEAVPSALPEAAIARAAGTRLLTGIGELDELLEASIAAIESNAFDSGVIAAGADGWYKNAWIRDGTYAVLGADLAGRRDLAARFFGFWIREGGFSWGGENEAQQPAIAILGLWTHSRLLPPAPAAAFLRETFPYVKRYADYYAKRVEKEDMIAAAEEWICQVPAPCSWPNAEVYAGLACAARIAGALAHGNAEGGAAQTADEAGWRAAAERLRSQIVEKAYDPSLRRFIPLAGQPGAVHEDWEQPGRSGPLRDERVDSGMLVLARAEVFGRGLGAVAVDDPRFAATQAWIHRTLLEQDRSISRFDANFASPSYPGGEWPVWPISAGWAAQVEHLRGRVDRAWAYLVSGVARKRGADHPAAFRQLPEQWRHDGRPVRTTRFLTWSHGEILTAAVVLLLGLDLDPEGADLGLVPSLPPGSSSAAVEGWPFRGWTFDVRIPADGAKATISARRGPDGARELLVATAEGVVRLGDGVPIAVPTRDRARPGPTARRGAAAERARLFWQILIGEDPPRPASPTAEAWEEVLRRAEDRFDAERLRSERLRREAEILRRLGPEGASTAGPLPAEGLRVATLFTAQEMAGALASEEGRAKALEWCRRHGVEHAFVESFRDGFLAPDAVLTAVRETFRAAGIAVSGCITPTGLGKPSTGWKTLSCYTSETTRARLRDVFAGAARLFDEVMIDDFLCTDCQCEECKSARGPASWAEHRMRLLREVSARDILSAARGARPGVRVIVKYPQWYDDFHNRGYDVAGETALYSAIWVGTETRDPDNAKWGRKAQYEAYFIQRWLGAVGGAKTGGGWFDPYGTSPATYVEQARQTVLAGAREMLLFCHASLVEPQHAPCTEALIPELPGLRELARRVAGRVPIGVAAAKPPSSQPAKEEEYIFDFVGMLGIPLVPCVAIPPGAPSALVTSHAAGDPATLAWLRTTASRPLLVTPAAEKALPAGVLAARSGPVSRLIWAKDPREVMDLSQAALDALRNEVLSPLGVRFSAPGRVALYVFAPGGEKSPDFAAVESFADAAVEVILEAGGWEPLERDAIVLPPSRVSEVAFKRRGPATAIVLPPRTLVAFGVGQQ